MFSDNCILRLDSYKASHARQYPEKTEYIFSYMEARSAAVLFFGLQYYISRYIAGIQVTEEKIAYAKQRFAKHFGRTDLFNEAGWRHILREHGGCLPIRIKAVKEGTFVPAGNVLMTVENTDPTCYWLTNYIESLLLQVWYPSTVATISRGIKETIKEYTEKTGGDLTTVENRLHDFGFRGVSSVESAEIGGAAHLVNFKGTDTFVANELLARYYGCEMAGFSIPAAEHSTITAWGRDRELDAYENMLDAYPDGYVAVVTDSYDPINACEMLWGQLLRDKILARKGTVVIRPDSGEPVKMSLDILAVLGRKFGVTHNDAGFRLLPPQIRVIYGDGIDGEMIDTILANMAHRGWCADNISFGMGGGLLQKLDRDTCGFAFKCSAARVDGQWRDVFKTSPGKKSKKGRLKLIRNEMDLFETVPERDVPYTHVPNELVLYFEDGISYNPSLDFSYIRQRAAI